MEPTRRERERERRRGDILDAANRVFADKGYRAATMDEIAAEAELSKGTLYLYFESKEALSLALSNRVLDTTIEMFTQIAARPACGVAKIEAMLLAYAENLLSNEEKFLVMIGRLASKTPTEVESPIFAAHRERVGQVVGLLVGAVSGGQQDGSIDASLDPLAVAAEVWGGMVGVTLMTINVDELNRRFPQPIEASRILPEFVRLLARGLRPSARDS